jgi:hypothetical protein
MGHGNLVAAKPRRRGTLVVDPRHNESAHDAEVRLIHGDEYGASNHGCGGIVAMRAAMEP